MNSFVPYLVHTLCEFLPAEFAGRFLALDVDGVTDWQSGQICDVLEVGLEGLLAGVLSRLLLVLHFDYVQVSG